MTKRLSENARRHIGETLTIRWGSSRGRYTYGYRTCSLRNHRGERVAACNGGGYDMKGTVIGDWIARTFRKELCALPLSAFPAQSHFERAEHPRRVCRNGSCIAKSIQKDQDLDWLPPDTEVCPKCGGETSIDHEDGKTVEDVPRLYGLSFHDPKYDPGKAVVGKDCCDRTMGKGAEGKTVEQSEAAGESVGLERYQAFYSASSTVPTKRHVVPLIDGVWGLSSVLSILHAVGLDLRHIANTSKIDVFEIVKASV